MLEEDKIFLFVMGVGLIEEEGAVFIEFFSFFNLEGCVGEVYLEGEGDILGGEERIVWVEDEGFLGFFGL